MCQATDLKKSWETSQEKYKLAKQKLSQASIDTTLLQAAAQEVNEAWLEFKEADLALNDYTILKKMELYHV